MSFFTRDKYEQAGAIIHACLQEQGVWADPSRYRHQCWTRDMGMAVAPLLHETGNSEVVKRHLENLFRQQRPNGQVPILFLDDEEAWVADKEAKSKKQGRPSFMLERYRAGELWNLTPGTKDSEIISLVAMYEYAKATRDTKFLSDHREHLNKAEAYIRSNLMVDGLTRGADWRDTMEKVLANKPLLTNNCLLYRAYMAMGECSKAEELRQAIRAQLMQNGRFIDYPGEKRFDPLGGAFAVLFGVAGPDDYRGLIESFKSVDSPCGVTIKCRHNPLDERERRIIERTDGVVVWPFVVGFTVMALAKMGALEFAHQQFAKLENHDGFREWYDPRNGDGCGADKQLWSATLYQRAVKALS